MKKAIMGGFARLTMVSLMIGMVGCASAPKYQEVTLLELKQQIENVKSTGQDFVTFVTEAYIFITETDSDFIIISDTQNQNEGIRVYLHGGRICSSRNCISKIDNKHYKHIILYQNNDLVKRIDTSKKYTIYIGVYYDNSFGSWGVLFADKIEGQFRTPEEYAAIEAQKKAEQESAAETRRLAQEEADRYDPSKFTIVPSDFRPSIYRKIDLFTAIANAESLPRINLPHLHSMADIYVQVEGGRLYTSDVVFVNQSGTDIVFRTDDNAISQSMKIADRSGLTSGQKVRLYYSVMKNPIIGFRVTAIERL